LAAAAVSVAIFVPRRRLAFVTEPMAELAKLPVAAAVTAWAVRLWQDATAPRRRYSMTCALLMNSESVPA